MYVALQPLTPDDTCSLLHLRLYFSYPFPRAPVCLLLKLRIYLPEDSLITTGETAEEMFILCKGKVSIRNESGDEIAQLHKGQFFGEFALIYEARRSATVKSIGVTEVSVLHHVVSKSGRKEEGKFSFSLRAYTLCSSLCVLFSAKRRVLS